MKNTEELNALKAEVEALNGKLAELSPEELSQVSGGSMFGSPCCPFCAGYITHTLSNTEGRYDWYNCYNCGYLTHFWDGDKWEKGYI